MNRRADQATRGIARQLGVGIERYDIANLGKKIRLAGRYYKAMVAGAAKQLIIFSQLAAFAFPANPSPLGLAPLPPPVKEMKSDRFTGIVSLIQSLDTLLCSV
jgi:hypothetical protein